MFPVLQNKQYFGCHMKTVIGIVSVSLHLLWWESPYQNHCPGRLINSYTQG